MDDKVAEDEKTQELRNINEAIKFIEENTEEGTKFDRAYVSELHKLVCYKLTPPKKGEGSCHPGELRKGDVEIKKSKHRPTPHEHLKDEFINFLDFINQPLLEKNQLLMAALAHHRFMYIHPFDNGNGRVGRLLNYALLIKLGFNVKSGRILNPSSVFYTDRDKYYEMLGKADSLKDEDALAWAEYFLGGIKTALEKIDMLTKRTFTVKRLLTPTLEIALDKKQITKQEFDILMYLINKKDMAMKTAELSNLGIKTTQQKTYAMQKLRDEEIVTPIKEGGRVYTINFTNNYLLRGMMQALQKNNFIADTLNNPMR